METPEDDSNITVHSAALLVEAVNNVLEAHDVQNETIKTMQQIAGAQGQLLARLEEECGLLRAMIISGR